MRIHFQKRPWDLHIALGYTLVLAATLLLTGVGTLVGVMLILVLPGYVAVAALFPGSREIDWIERMALSLGLSIAIVPLLGVLLNFTPWGIRFAPMVTTIAIFTVLVGLVAYWRRMRLPEEDRLTATFVLHLPGWKEQGPLDRFVTIALAASILVAVSSLAYVVLTPRAREPFTEFYILGPGGNASGYPTNLTPSEPGAVIIGVVNHETVTMNYAVGVDLVGVRIVFNSTSGKNQTDELNRTSMSSFNFSLGDGWTWTQPYTFSIPSAALWIVQFLLYESGILTDEIHLLVRVT